MKRVQQWDELWSEPASRLERYAPLVALGLAVVIALF